MGNVVKMRGIVEIVNGDKRIVAENHLLNAFIEGIIGFMGSRNTIWGMAYDNHNAWKMRIGHDTSNPTVPEMTDLANPIVDGNGAYIEPNNLSIGASNPENGLYRFVVSATWDAGTVSGVLGEVGLWGRVWTDFDTTSSYPITIFGSSDHYDIKMVARLSSASNEFEAFNINETQPLTITYTIEFDVRGGE